MTKFRLISKALPSVLQVGSLIVMALLVANFRELPHRAPQPDKVPAAQTILAPIASKWNFSSKSRKQVPGQGFSIQTSCLAFNKKEQRVCLQTASCAQLVHCLDRKQRNYPRYRTTALT